MATLPPKDTGSAKALNASFTIGTEASDVINVAVQLEWAHGAEADRRLAVLAYLSDDANGDSVIATAHSGGVAIGTDGVAMELIADKVFLLTSESDGDIDIDITETGGKTAHLAVVLPTGDLVVSDAITHAA